MVSEDGKGAPGEWENLEAEGWLGASLLFQVPSGLEPPQQQDPRCRQLLQGLCPERTAANSRSLPEGVEGLGGHVLSKCRMQKGLGLLQNRGKAHKCSSCTQPWGDKNTQETLADGQGR